jgi:hypothetical protein
MLTESAMQQRRHFSTALLDEPFAERAERLRKEARGTPPGVARDNLIRRARQAETASRVQEWATSSGLQTPK